MINFFTRQLHKAVFPVAVRSSTSAPLIEKELSLFAARKRTPVSLKSLLETGKGELLNKHTDAQIKDDGTKAATARVQIQVACFLHHELPVRFAHRVSTLESSPVLKQSGKMVFCVIWNF